MIPVSKYLIHLKKIHFKYAEIGGTAKFADANCKNKF